MIDRCQQVQPLINALAVKRFSQAIEDARGLDMRLREAKRLANEMEDWHDLDKILYQMPLFGIPVTIKETVAVKGLPQTLGMVRKRNVTANSNARVVDLLIESGLIVLATTNVPEFTLWWADCQVGHLYPHTTISYTLVRLCIPSIV